MKTKKTKKIIDAKTLYELTPVEFENLCSEILKTQGYKHIEIVGGPGDQGIDIIGENKNRKVAVQVKHLIRINIDSIDRIVKKIIASDYKPSIIIIMTSAPVSQSIKSSAKKLFSTEIIHIYDRDDLLKILENQSQIQLQHIQNIQKRKNSRLTQMIISTILIIIGLSLSLSVLIQKEKTSLQEQINTVETAIKNLNDLEKNLATIKNNMIETEKATEKIKLEYLQAKELEKITEEQYETIKKAVSNKSWQNSLFNNFIGFIVGIAASIIANILYGRFKKFSILNKTE